MDAPLWGDTGGHTGTAPTHFIIFFHTIPCKQNNHLCATHPNGANRSTRNLLKRHQPVLRAICSNETVGAVPVCPPERPRSGVSIREIGFVHHVSCRGITMYAPLQGDTGGHTGAAPTHLHQTMRCAITHCTFDSSRQPHGVPLPRSGYTFDSAGLASATQPTLGNGDRRGGYPQRGLYFLSPQTNDAAPTLTMLHHMLTMLRHAQSTQTKRVNNLLTTQTGRRKCIAHSRPLNSK